MIRTFKGKIAERIFVMHHAGGFPAFLYDSAREKLLMLDAAINLKDLAIPPGNRLEPLKGNRLGQYSIRINRQMRICFVWREGHAYEVEIVDYH